MRGIRSLDVITEEVRLQRQEQADFFNLIDTKAGIVLGFAAAIVALGPTYRQSAVIAGRWFAHEILKQKAVLLKAAMVALVVAVLLAALGLASLQ